MLDPTNYLNNLNKRIEITSSEIGNVQLKESFVLNSRRNAIDLNSIGDYLNEVIVKSYATLCSNPRYPKDAVVNGLSGMTMVTWLEEDGNNKFNSPAFWFGSDNPDVDGRPCTIKESIQYLWENLNERVIQTQSDQTDLGPLEDAISCLDTMLTQLKIDTYGENFVLDCGGAWSKQKWSVSKHVFETLSQLTIGHDAADLTGLNHGETSYPNLSWNIELNDLLDVDTVNVPLSSGYALIWNEESQQWQPGKGHIQYAYELLDIDYGEGNTKVAEGQLLVWENDPADPDNDGGAGAWVPKYPSDVFTDTDTRTEYLTQLHDVNIEHPLDTTNKNLILKFNPESTDPATGTAGRWEPEDLNQFIPEPVDLTTNVGQRIGGARRDSTLDDVYSVSEIVETWLADNGLSSLEEADLDQRLDLTKRSATRFRAGASLTYDGDLWHSKLAGNTSNLNEVEFIPEIHLKGSSYISGLSSIEKERLIFGGYNAIPFVFINNFDIKMKEVTEPNFKRILLSGTNGVVPSTGNSNIDALSQMFDEGSIGKILNSEPASDGRILDNEITTNNPSRPIASTKVSEKYTDEYGVERVYYKPEKVLGVCRTDIQVHDLPIPGLPTLTENFLRDSEGNLTGEINPSLSYLTLYKVAKNVGIEIQHSGYSRIMVLGPYVHGDNLYICPAPILEIGGINYPYGICISDTFLSTPLKDLFLGEKDILLSGNFPSIYNQATMSIYDLIGVALNTVDSNLKNKILSHPVAFVTRDDSPFRSLDVSSANTIEENETHNVANTICRNLLALNSAAGSSTGGGSPIYAAIISYFNSISESETAQYLVDVLHATGGSLATKYIYNAGALHLPLCKIATGSFNHEGVNQTINNFDWATYINPSIIDGYLNLAGLNLGLVTGEAGANGTDGQDGANGLNAMIMVPGQTISHPPKSDGTADVIPANYDLMTDQYSFDDTEFNRNSYPTLENFDFSFQIRISNLTQPVRIIVSQGTRSLAWKPGDDVPLMNPISIYNEFVEPGNSLIFDEVMFANGNTITINNNSGKINMDNVAGVFVDIAIYTTEENANGLNDICSEIYTNLIINPN
jgi:hypothetical protein